MIHCNILKFTRKDIIGGAGMSKMALWEYNFKKEGWEHRVGFLSLGTIAIGPHHSLSRGCPVVLGVWQHAWHLPTRQHLHLSVVSRHCQISPGRRAKLPPIREQLGQRILFTGIPWRWPGTQPSVPALWEEGASKDENILSRENRRKFLTNQAPLPGLTGNGTESSSTA